MRFMISKADGFMAFNNAALPIDLSTIASNVRFIIWHDLDGEIEYNDRLNLRSHLTDPSPYQTCINNWITAAAAAASPLTLALAQQIKTDMIEAIFASKRQTPITVTVTAGTLSFDTTDSTVASMNQAGAAGGSVTLVELQAAFVKTANDMNGVIIDTLAGGGIPMPSPPTLAATSDFFSAMVAPLNTAFALIYSQVHRWAVAWAGGGGPSTSASISGSGANVAAINAALAAMCTSINAEGPTAPGPLMQVFPSGGSALIVSAVDAAVIINGIAQRWGSLQSVRLAKEAAIAALSTIPAVVAYDATAGWPF